MRMSRRETMQLSATALAGLQLWSLGPPSVASFASQVASLKVRDTSPFGCVIFTRTAMPAGTPLPGSIDRRNDGPRADASNRPAGGVGARKDFVKE